MPNNNENCSSGPSTKNNYNREDNNSRFRRINQVGTNLEVERGPTEVENQGTNLQDIANTFVIIVDAEEYAQYLQYKNKQSESRGKATTSHHIDTVSTSY